jgi:hypothetical protein
MLDVDSLTFLLVYSKVWTTLRFCESLVCKGKHGVMDVHHGEGKSIRF